MCQGETKLDWAGGCAVTQQERTTARLWHVVAAEAAIGTNPQKLVELIGGRPEVTGFGRSENVHCATVAVMVPEPVPGL
jgi:hypothetical protein